MDIFKRVLDFIFRTLTLIFVFHKVGPVLTLIDFVENYNHPRSKRENLPIVAWVAAATEPAATPAEVNPSIIIFAERVSICIIRFRLDHKDALLNTIIFILTGCPKKSQQ